VGYLVRWVSAAGVRTELAFATKRKTDAIASARGAVEDGEREVELLDNGKPLPRHEFAPAKTPPAAKLASHQASKRPPKARSPKRKSRA
jgi:hypothetical protein